MSDTMQYQQATRRASTTRRYAQAIERFERVWGGLLPTSSESVVRYLAASASTHSSGTLRTHLAALTQWHQQRAFPDPTKTAQVSDTLRGIRHCTRLSWRRRCTYKCSSHHRRAEG